MSGPPWNTALYYVWPSVCSLNIIENSVWKTDNNDFCRSEVENIESEKEILLRKLVEVEMDGKAAAEEVGKLRDTVRRLKHVCLQLNTHIIILRLPSEKLLRIILSLKTCG